MRIRRALFVLSFTAAAYVGITGCGDDETPATPADDAGAVSEASTQDTSPPLVDAQTDSRSPELTGLACQNVSECYAGLDASALNGEAVCLDKVQDGYCTHKCVVDEDCCAIPGECKTGLKQVCAPLSNQADKYCFLSCEEADILTANDAGATDAGNADGGFDGDGYCHTNASASLGCRSSGGGTENRKVCLPAGGGGGDGGGGGKKDAGGDASDASDASDSG